jgi:hypothetical protein
MLSNTSFGVRPTAIYANPVLLDLIDREMKTEFNVVLSTPSPSRAASRSRLLDPGRRDSADSGMDAALHRDTRFGLAVLPAYIVTEDLIEYHWLGDPNPGLPARRARARWPRSMSRSSSARGGQGRELRALPGAGRPLDSDSLIDSQVQALLRPYVAERLG